MKLIALFILSAAALLELQMAAVEGLMCYWCAGYDYSQDPSEHYNTKNCALDSFNKEGMYTNNTEAPEGSDVACVTASIYSKGWNSDKPFTFRGAGTHKRSPSSEWFQALNSDLFDEDVIDAATKATPSNPVYFGLELCFEDYCNTHTYHGGASTFSVPGISLLLLPAIALRYFM